MEIFLCILFLESLVNWFGYIENPGRFYIEIQKKGGCSNEKWSSNFE